MPVKILLADKSITIQKVVEMLFSGREYEVQCVSDGETAMNDAARMLPDVVLADVDLPRIDGYTLSARLKQTPVLADTPVILMMSRDDVFDSAKGKQAGIVDNIAKPFESQELITKVKKAVAAAPARPAVSVEPAAPLPRTEETFAEPAALSPAPARPKQATPANIFDIIEEAPTEKDVRTAAAPAAPDASEFIVEAEVEEVNEPLVREVEKALPVGDKAVEEMRAGLGLSGGASDTKADILSFESFEEALEPAPPAPVTPAIAEPSPRPAPPMPEALEAELAPERPAAPQEPVASASAGEKVAAPPVQQTQLTESDLWSIAEETISKMSKTMFENMPLSEETVLKMAEEKIAKLAQEAFAKLPSAEPPRISEEAVLKMAEEKVTKLAQITFGKLPPPRIPDDLVRSIAEEKIMQLAQEAVQAVKMPEPPKLSEKELRSMAEATVSLMAADIFKNMPPPPMPKVSDETVRRGLEAVLAKIAREMAREVIEQVAWEVIPPLAEQLIKAEIERIKAAP